MPPTFMLTLISAAVAGAAGFGLAWRLQSANILEMQNEAQQTRIMAQRVARAAIERSMSALAVSQNNSALRGTRLRADLASADLVGSGLRIKTDSAVRAASSDPALCSDTASTLGELLNTVSTERRALAETADRHVIDIQALMERQATAP